MKLEWKIIDSTMCDNAEHYYKADVEGGYILKHRYVSSSYQIYETMVFIPNQSTIDKVASKKGLKNEKR